MTLGPTFQSRRQRHSVAERIEGIRVADQISGCHRREVRGHHIDENYTTPLVYVHTVWKYGERKVHVLTVLDSVAS